MVRGMNTPSVLRSTTKIAQQQRLEGELGSPSVVEREGLRQAALNGGRYRGMSCFHQSRNSLPVRVMNTVSSVGSAHR